MVTLADGGELVASMVTLADGGGRLASVVTLADGGELVASLEDGELCLEGEGVGGGCFTSVFAPLPTRVPFGNSSGSWRHLEMWG